MLLYLFIFNPYLAQQCIRKALGVGVWILPWNFYSHFVHLVALNSVNWEEKLGAGVGDHLADTP